MPTEADAAVLQQVTQVVEHGFLVLTANAAEVAQEATAAGHHLWEGDLLQRHAEKQQHCSCCSALHTTHFHKLSLEKQVTFKEAHCNHSLLLHNYKITHTETSPLTQFAIIPQPGAV